MSGPFLLCLALASLGVYGLRASGLLFGNLLPREGRARRFLEALPGTLFVAILSVDLLGRGLPGLAAAGAVALTMGRTRNLLLSLLLGLVCITLLRRLGGTP